MLFENYQIHVYISIFWLIATTPCLYLYFYDIVFEKKWNRKKNLHLLMPAILTVLFVYFIIAKKNNWINSIIVLSIFYSFFYAFAIFRLLYKEVWNRKSDIKSVQSQNQIIRNWSLFLFLSMSIVIVVRLLVWIFFSPLTHQFFYIDNFTWFSAFLWLIIYSIVLIKPEILYGYQYLQKIVDYASVKSSFFMASRSAKHSHY